MLLSNLHPHLKLGFLLLVAAALLVSGISATFLALTASDRLGLSGSQYGWLSTAGRLGGLFVLAAVIWLDSRPPHGMMAAGTLVLAIGLALLILSNSFALAVVSTFVMGAGGAAVGSLIFYVVIVKGVARYKGMLIGAISLVFNVMGGSGAFRLLGDRSGHRMVGRHHGSRGGIPAFHVSPPLVRWAGTAWADIEGNRERPWRQKAFSLGRGCLSDLRHDHGCQDYTSPVHRPDDVARHR